MAARRPVAPRAGRPTAPRTPARPMPRTTRASSRPSGTKSAAPKASTKPSVRGSAKPAAKASQTSRRTAAGKPTVERPEEPRQVTVRAVTLFVVILVAFVVLAPTLRAYVTQQEQLRQLDDAIAAGRDRNAALQATIDRWGDPLYLQTQARDRLGYVMPGETPYIVVDPETVTGEEPADTAEDGPVLMPRSGPWYLTVWDSVQVAGEVDD